MNQQKMSRAERLFDAIGDIEDRYIAEAQSPYAPRRSRRILLTRLLPVALSFPVLLIGAYMAFMMGTKAQKEDTNMAEEVMDDANFYSGEKLADGASGSSVGSATLTTDQTSPHLRLTQLLASAEAPTVDGASLSVTDGTPRLIWKQANEDTYRALVLTAEQVTALTEELAKETGAPLSDPDSVSLRLWIVTADGSVLTPYLPHPTQNGLSDYEPTTAPTAKLVDQIEKILKANP